MSMEKKLADALREAFLFVSNVPTDSQLDAKVSAMSGATARGRMGEWREALAEYDAQHATAPTFNRFDIAEAYACLESDYNVGGMLEERPSNMRRREPCGVQLHRMRFRARPDLERDTLTANGRAIYDAAVRRLGLPV